MLEITSQHNFDIFSVILIIAKHNLQTSVSNKKILLEDTIIPAKVLEEICKVVPNFIVRNYSEEMVESELSQTEPITKLKRIEKTEQTESKYKTTVKGDVFYCDFGTPYEHEIGYDRPAIVLWNFSDRVLVLPCTTNSSVYEGKFKISLKSDNFKVCSRAPSSTDSMGVIGQLRIVDKTRLLTKIGTLKNEVFSDIMLTVQAYLMFKVTGLTSSQLEMLKGNMSKLQVILESSESDSIKITEILNTYGFSSTVNGFSFLRDAILYSLELDSVNMSSLCQKVSENTTRKMDASDIERTITARFKEVFGKKYKTIYFIRLIRALLKEETA